MKLSELFKIGYGQKEHHNKENLDYGNTLLISSQAANNGCYGFFEVEAKFKPPFITAPSTGSIGFACVQLTKAAVADDALVLVPLKSYPKEYLFYIAVVIRETRWRYNYGRKITPKRLGSVEVRPPEEFKTNVNYEKLQSGLWPRGAGTNTKTLRKPQFKKTRITELFELERGQFHALNKLEVGACATISRVSTDNGLVGFYRRPKTAILYKDCFITISTVTGDAFLQFKPFIATDNVLICKPKMPLRITSLIYIQALINKVKWRYSYGRQCYKRIFQKAVIYLPITSDGKPDEDYMEATVTEQHYWEYFKQTYLSS